MDAAVLLKGVTKTFGRTTAVDHLDLVVPRGALYGFIGPNGAGKTTTIRMIMSILFPDSGELSVLGHPSALDAKDRIGYLPEERGVYRKMRVGAFLTYMGRLKGVNEAELPARVRRGLERVGLADCERKRCEELSKGMQQKVQFLAAIIHEPDLLILDEPFSGLDPVSARSLRELILEEHRRGATILFSTHVMPHAEETVRSRRDDSSRAQGARRSARRHPAPVRSAGHPVRSARSRRGSVAARRAPRGGTCRSRRWRLRDSARRRHEPGEGHSRLATAVAAARIEIARPRLEDIFIRIVTGGSATPETEQQLRADLRGLGAQRPPYEEDRPHCRS